MLFDLCFFEGYVLARNRIVLFEGQLFSCRPWVLLGDVEKASPRRAQKLDLLGDGLGHDSVSAAVIGGTLFGRNR
jgi:hypothetical protein